MTRKWLPASALVVTLASASPALAVSSAELYQNATYTYGRFEARVRFAAGDGIVSSFFLWKPGSEVAGTYWNELDFEKLGADCRMQTNPLYGLPVSDHGQIASVSSDLCGEYHTYAFEWTPTYIAWLIDGVEVRREEGETAAAFELNAAAGMQIHFNLWPGDASFGGNFDAAILPVQQYISWVQYSSFEAGSFMLQWREDFTAGAVPPGWATGNWASPKNYSTHAPANVGFASGTAVLSLTADDATGFAGEPPPDEEAVAGAGGAGGASSGEPPSDDEGAAAGGGAAGAAGAASASDGSAGSASGSISGGGTGAAPGLTPPRAPSSDSCSLGTPTTGAAGRWGGLLLLAITLAAQRRRGARSRR